MQHHKKPYRSFCSVDLFVCYPWDYLQHDAKKKKDASLQLQHRRETREHLNIVITSCWSYIHVLERVYLKYPVISRPAPEKYATLAEFFVVIGFCSTEVEFPEFPVL